MRRQGKGRSCAGIGMPAEGIALPKTGNLQVVKTRTLQKTRILWKYGHGQRRDRNVSNDGWIDKEKQGLLECPHERKIRKVWMVLAKGETIPSKSAHYLLRRRRKHLNHCVAQSQGGQHLRIV